MFKKPPAAVATTVPATSNPWVIVNGSCTTVSVSTGGTILGMVIVNCLVESVCGVGLFESVIVTVYGVAVVTVTLGVPDTSPVSGFMLNPLGRVAVNFSGGTPPVAVTGIGLAIICTNSVSTRLGTATSDTIGGGVIAN